VITKQWSNLGLLISRAEGQSAVKGAAALSLSEVLYPTPNWLGDIPEGAYARALRQQPKRQGIP
jgi:hypothetical protein